MKAVIFFVLIITLSIVKISSQNPILVHDINSGPSDSYPKDLIVFNNKLYFSATDGIHGTELFEYDGDQPPILYDLSTVYNGSWPSFFCVFNNKMYFGASDELHGRELWSFDGENQPIMEYDISEGYFSSFPAQLISFNNRLFFTASGDSHGNELWSFDGINPPELVYDIHPGGGYAVIAYMTILNDKLYFKAFDGVSAQLWEYDGINNPISVSNIPGLDPKYLCAFNDKIYFCGYDDERGNELWVYDDDTGQTSILADIYPGFTIYYDPGGNPHQVPNNSSPRYLIVYKDKLYFSATDSISGKELWVYDGLNNPTLVVDLFPGGQSSYPRNLSIYNNVLYFSATADTCLHYNLWAYDGLNNPVLAGDINNTAYYPTYLKQFNDKLYFSADDYSLFGTELWSYDDLSTSISAVEVSREVTIFPVPTSDVINITITRVIKDNVTNQCLEFRVPKLPGVKVSYRNFTEKENYSLVYCLFSNVSLSNLINFRHFLL